MCDYSLHAVASRPAKVGDQLITSNFKDTFTHGFSAVGEPEVAVCLLPGTELAFEAEARSDWLQALFFNRGRWTVGHNVGVFRQIDMDNCHRVPRRPNRTAHALAHRTARHGDSVAGSPAGERGRGSRSRGCAARNGVPRARRSMERSGMMRRRPGVHTLGPPWTPGLHRSTACCSAPGERASRPGLLISLR